MNREELIEEIAVYLADDDRSFEYSCAFVDLPEEDQNYYLSLATTTIKVIEEWAEIKFPKGGVE